MDADSKPQVEIPLVEQPKEEVKTNPVDLAARDFQNMLPEFEKRLDSLSKKGLKKLLFLITEYPLGDKVNMTMLSNLEKEVFYLGLHLMDAKFVMMRTVLDSKKEELEKLSKETIMENQLAL